MRNVAILLFDEAEELDFVGPLEVFAAASELHAETPFAVYTVAEHTRAIRAHNGLRVLPEYCFSTCPSADILIISGGKILTSGGISPGIDLSLHVVSKLLGEAHAQRTARYIGYPWLVKPLV